MNNCRAGLYSFASTTTWLHETGMASPPLLVILGLALPDSRILSGIASIGLTLVNIAIILPHLRQPIRNSTRVLKGTLASERSTQEQIKSSLDRSNSTQSADLDAEKPVPALVSITEKEHQTPPLTCATASKSLECSNIESEVAPQVTILTTTRNIRDGQITSQIPPSLGADFSESHASPSGLFTRESRGALYISLPVPDEAEIAFFGIENVTPNNDPEEGYIVPSCEQHTILGGRSAREDHGRTTEKDIEHSDQFIVADILSVRQCGDVNGNSTDVTTLVTGENPALSSMDTTIQDHRESISGVPDGSPARGGTTSEQHPLGEGKEALTKYRPESLEFIPQSVLRRYPSAPGLSAGHGSEHQPSGLKYDHRVSPVPLHIFVQNPAMLLEGTRPRASYTMLEAHWCASFLNEVHPTRRPTEGQSFIIKNTSGSDPETTVHELHLLDKRRMGVLARTALRDRIFSTRSHRNDEDSVSSISDSDSDSDNDSQHSGGSSVYENMVPHMLGADLIAAIDANSEPDLNFARTKWKMHTPLNTYEDFLASEESAADVSMIMQVSSHGDACDGAVRDPLRSLTYEDIQQWASGVVQKCTRQVCRNSSPVEPSSPSQVSDVCAERPSGSGISQCPLSGLHCRLGATALTQASVLRTRELPVSLPPTSIPPGQKPLQVRNLRDIPEFVPRQRRVSAVAGTGRAENLQRLGTRASIDVTRAAATRVIARMETQAGFNPRQWFVGMDEKRMVNTAGGRQSTLRCA